MLRLLNTRPLLVIGLVIGLAAAGAAGMRLWQSRDGGRAPPAQWQYAATAGGARTASLQSRNRLKAPAPFKGGPATLSLARGPDGYIVRLDVDADMACSYAPTASTVQVTFDGAAPRTFACAPAPDDHSRLLFDGAHSTAYFADPVAFLARVRNARHIRILGEFAGQTPRQTMDFDLPPGDPVAQVSPVSNQLAQAPLPAAPAMAMEAVAVAATPKPMPAADVAAGNPGAIAPAHRTPVRVAARRHVPGYYLHPYRPERRRAYG